MENSDYFNPIIKLDIKHNIRLYKKTPEFFHSNHPELEVNNEQVTNAA
jgi:hypothetical protein